MSIADKKYKELLITILRDGVWDSDGSVRTVYKDGSPAYSKSIFGVQVKFNKGEIPIITSKKTPVQSSINEVVHAFFRLKTNKLVDFHNLGIKYWDEWGQDDQTIGRSYGWQLANQKEVCVVDGETVELDQVDNILHKLKNDPYSRRIMFSYWNPGDVDKKALQECAWSGQFNVRSGHLDFLLCQRSVDTLLGLPSNWAGYYALQCTLAKLFNLEVGTFTHQMGNVHLYDNQIEIAKDLIEAPEYDQPEIWVNPKVNNFYDLTVDDVKVRNYQSGKSFRSEVAI